MPGWSPCRGWPKTIDLPDVEPAALVFDRALRTDFARIDRAPRAADPPRLRSNFILAFDYWLRE